MRYQKVNFSVTSPYVTVSVTLTFDLLNSKFATTIIIIIIIYLFSKMGKYS